jgi:hypothetical protein
MKWEIARQRQARTFALETHVEEIAIAMRDFLRKLPHNTA